MGSVCQSHLLFTTALQGNLAHLATLSRYGSMMECDIDVGRFMGSPSGQRRMTSRVLASLHPALTHPASSQLLCISYGWECNWGWIAQCCVVTNVSTWRRECFDSSLRRTCPISPIMTWERKWQFYTLSTLPLKTSTPSPAGSKVNLRSLPVSVWHRKAVKTICLFK